MSDEYELGWCAMILGIEIPIDQVPDIMHLLCLDINKADFSDIINDCKIDNAIIWEYFEQYSKSYKTFYPKNDPDLSIIFSYDDESPSNYTSKCRSMVIGMPIPIEKTPAGPQEYYQSGVVCEDILSLYEQTVQKLNKIGIKCDKLKLHMAAGYFSS